MITGMVGILAGAVVVLGFLALVARRAITRRRAQPELKESPPPSTWRLLVTTADLYDAIDRAIACEQESMRQYQARAARYGDMRSRVGAVATIQPIAPRRPPQVS
jgi:hypothetical protein